jgi:hypothetical protein
MEGTQSMKPLTIAGQIFLYSLFAVVIGIFSRWPSYQALAADQAMLKLSFSHHGKPIAECRQASAAELAKLPPNMRAPTVCPRQRSPVLVELDIDGKQSYRHTAMPSGLSKDGASAVYHRLELAAGSHHIAVRINDDARAQGFQYLREATVTLKPAQILVIDLDTEKAEITLQ